jgi:hypothetical protein
MHERLVTVALALVVALTVGCASLEQTRQLPSPNPASAGQGGPEGEAPDYME